MIVFDLECRAGGHRFEGWFGSSDAFAGQQARGLVTCPQCGSADVAKAPMAPNVARKGNQLPAVKPAPAAQPAAAAPAAIQAAAGLPPEARAALAVLAKIQAEALKSSRWVGKSFAEDARAMHYGEAEAEQIHGQATPDEARALADEGVAVAPILFQIAPPGEVN